MCDVSRPPDGATSSGFGGCFGDFLILLGCRLRFADDHVAGGAYQFLVIPKVIGWRDGAYNFSWLIALVNVVPVVVAITVPCTSKSSNCPAIQYDGAPNETAVECNTLDTVLDRIGLISARIARFDLAICLSFSSRGSSGFLFVVSGGWLGVRN